MTNLMRRTTRLPSELDDFFESFLRTPSWFNGAPTPTIDEGALALDVSENDGEVIVRASLPGFDKDDVEVEVHDGVLTIKATHDEQSEESDERFYRRERRSGSLSRRVALPGAVDNAKAVAVLSNGVLEVRVGKTAQAQPHKLPIS